jgi:Flp pilus assembly protein TadG
MCSFFHKHCRYLLFWSRGFFGGLSGVLAVLVPLAMQILAKTMRRATAVRDASGTVAVEFAFIGPVLLLAMVGMFVFGIALNNWVILTNAAEAGALQLAISRGDSTPYTDTTNEVYNAAPSLTKASITITLSVNGTACTSDATCQTALTANAGNPAYVQATYPCMPGNSNLTVMGKNYSTACTLTVKTTERIQ